MTRADQRLPPPDRQLLVGTMRRFGDLGPVYEVLAVDERPGKEDWVMRIRVVESGEELDYTLAELLDDPQEG